MYRIWLAGRWRIAYEVDDESRRVEILRVRRKELMDYESLEGSSYVHEPQAEYDGEQTRPGRKARPGASPGRTHGSAPTPMGPRGPRGPRLGDSPDGPDVLTWPSGLRSRPSREL